MSGYRYGIVSVEDYIDCGLRLQLSASRTLEIYRYEGGKIRTKEFHERWNKRREQHHSPSLGMDAVARSA